MQFSELQKLSDVDLDLGSGRNQAGAHIWSRSSHKKIISKLEKLFVDIWRDGHT